MFELNAFIKRLFDLILAIVLLTILSVLFLLIMILISIESSGGPFFRQVRVGKNNLDFKIWKFRTMYQGADKKGLLTVGDRDARVTKLGFILRKYKLDELPQLFNIIRGEMSFVGPRPEVRKYINLLSDEQLNVLSVRPGLTDFASIKYVNESQILSQCSDPEKKYVEDILPEKIELGRAYIEKSSMVIDIRLIFQTLYKIVIK